MSTVRRTYGKHPDLGSSSSDISDNESPPKIGSTSESKILSPKSKIAAMLAEMDASDESGEDVSLARISNTKASSIGHHIKRLGAERSEQALTVSQIMRSDDSEEENDAQSESAYSRVRQQLLSKRRQKSVALDTPLRPESHRDLSSTDEETPKMANAAVPTSPPVLVTPNSRKKSARDRLELLASKRTAALGAEQTTPLEDQSSARQQLASEASDSTTDSEDLEAEIRMSSTRKVQRRAASKKAMEEMHKETERIQRSMTLAPDARVKTKLKVTDFLAKVGFVQAIPASAGTVPELSADHSLPHEKPQENYLCKEAVTDFSRTGEPSVAAADEPCPTLSHAFAPELEESDEDIELPCVTSMFAEATQEINASIPKESISIHEDILLDSASDSNPSSEVDLPARLKNHKLLFKKRDFQQIKQDRRAAKFVAMARPDSPTKLEARAERARKAALIAQVARQAKLERAEREAAMKAAGITIVSAEQREREAVEIESLVDKARKQADELRRLEKKEDQKRKAEADGVNDMGSESDDDWQGDAEDNTKSDSESEEDSEDDGDLNNPSAVEQSNEACQQSPPRTPTRNSFILSERSLTDEEEDAADLHMPRRMGNKARATRIIDAEDDCDEDKENFKPNVSSFGLSSHGLTQLFESTQRGLDTQPAQFGISVTQLLQSPPPYVRDSMRDLRTTSLDTSHSPSRSIPGYGERLSDRIPSSQPGALPDRQPFADTQFSVFDPPSPDDSFIPMLSRLDTQFTQATEVDPLDPLTALGDRIEGDFDVTSRHEKPRRSRLRRAHEVEEPVVESGLLNEPTPVNAFKVMRQAMDDAQHQKSRKALLDDRAVESDDEYAGLGGLSDEEPEDAAALAAELEDMIDHSVQDDDAEGQQRIAAFYAQKDLENDEKLVNTLMNDINNGGLRRKRGAGLLDMDDSEDEEEGVARHKARQALMRARLLESQNLTSLAENPKTKAFIEALEDRPSSTTFIDIVVEEESNGLSGAQGPSTADTQRSLVREDGTMDPPVSVPQKEVEAIAGMFKRPNKKATRADIQNELSFLREEDDDSQTILDFDPSFVPSLKRERSSLSIQDRAHLSRENSQTWRDPRSNSQNEDSMYSQLASSRTLSSRDVTGPPVVVISKGTHMASRMATKAVNYHARAAQSLKQSVGNLKKVKQKKDVGVIGSKTKKHDVLRLLA